MFEVGHLGFFLISLRTARQHGKCRKTPCVRGGLLPRDGQTSLVI